MEVCERVPLYASAIQGLIVFLDYFVAILIVSKLSILYYNIYIYIYRVKDAMVTGARSLILF